MRDSSSSDGEASSSESAAGPLPADRGFAPDEADRGGDDGGLGDEVEAGPTGAAPPEAGASPARCDPILIRRGSPEEAEFAAGVEVTFESFSSLIFVLVLMTLRKPGFSADFLARRRMPCRVH